MGKKMKLPFLSKSSQFTTPSWPWPSCAYPKTLSFRSTGEIFKTVITAYVTNNTNVEEKTARDCNQMSEPPESDSDVWLKGAIEGIIIELRSDDRLCFDPGETRSILEEVINDNLPFKESVVMVMDSRDPCVDFKNSMNEMVEAHEMRDWDSLEQLLNLYLRVNEETNCGYVIEAFVDLLVDHNFCNFLNLGCCNDQGESSSSNTIHDSMSSPLSFSFSTISTSPCLTNSLELVENDSEKEVDSSSQ